MSHAKTLEVPGYQVVEFLGSGARSTIWKIRQRSSEKFFALKRVVKRHGADGRFLDQATNEYNVGIKLSHDVVRGICQMRRIKHWLSLREIHLVMEFCEGQAIQEARPKSLRETLRVFGQVASALAYMNARGYVHADMKPNNIIVAPNGAVKIIDLGQSCPLGTIKQRIQGTPDFIAPEQVHRHPLDARTDVFNFGASLYWTLTGRAIPTTLPRNGPTTLKSEMAVVPPEKINTDVPPSLSKLVTDCIEISPAGRPTTMNEVASRLSLIAHTLQRKAANPQDNPRVP